MSPRVPTYDQPQVRQAALPNARIGVDTRGTHGEAIAAGIQDAGQAVSQLGEVYQRAKQKADLVASDRSILDLKAEADDAFYNRESGLMAAEGDAAIARATVAYDRIAKKRQDLASKTLQNDEQRQAFNEHADALQLDWKRQIETHVYHQRKVIEKITEQSTVSKALDDVANNYAVPKSRAFHIAEAAAAIRKYQFSKEEGDAKVADLQQKADKIVLNQYISAKDHEGARAYFAQAKERLGADSPQFEHAIGILGDKLGADSDALKILRSSPDPKGASGWVDRGAVFAQLEALPAGERKDRTDELVRRYLSERESAKQQEIDGRFNSALTAFQKRRSLGDINPQDEAWLHAYAPLELEKLRNLAQSEAQRSRNAPATAQQEATFAKFKVDASDNPDKYATMPLERFQREWLPLMAPSDRDNAVNYFAQLHGQAAKPETLSPIEQRMLMQVGREAEIFPAKGNDISQWNDRAFNIYYRAAQLLTEKASAYKKLNGKPPPDEQMLKWTNEALMKGTRPSTGWFSDDKTVRIEAEMKGTGYKPSWTDEDTSAAEKALRDAGALVDEKAVDNYLRRKHSLPAAPISAGSIPEPEANPSKAKAEADALQKELARQRGKF